MLILKKHRKFYFQPKNVIVDKDIESLLPIINSPRRVAFEKWYEYTFHNIEKITEYIYQYLKNMQEIGYKYNVNKTKLRQQLVQYIYNVSSNSYKYSPHLKDA